MEIHSKPLLNEPQDSTAGKAGPMTSGIGRQICFSFSKSKHVNISSVLVLPGLRKGRGLHSPRRSFTCFARTHSAWCHDCGDRNRTLVLMGRTIISATATLLDQPLERLADVALNEKSAAFDYETSRTPHRSPPAACCLVH